MVADGLVVGPGMENQGGEKRNMESWREGSLGKRHMDRYVA